jgi:uncharacterized protein (TIGR02687 family)
VSHQRIIEALQAQFASQAVLFWDDPEGEFSTWVDTLELDDVRILRLDRTPALQIKLDVERAPRDRWLLYSPVAEPEPVKDWLLDLRLRGKAFRADSTSILLDDLGLTTQALRPYLKTRAKFLRAKERVERLRRIVVASDDADALDRKMLAVLVRAEQPDFQTILLKVLTGMVQDDAVDFETAPRAWQEVVTNELDAAFWALARRELGYRLEGGEGEPSLRDLLYCILVTDFCRSLSGAVPASLKHFVLPDRALAANASVFAGRWRSDIGAYQTYNRVSDAVAIEIGLSDVLDSLTAEQLTESMSFSLVERRILRVL